VRVTTPLWDEIVRGAKAVGAALWELGADVRNAIKHGEPNEREGRP
jgi:hypothetical protein